MKLLFTHCYSKQNRGDAAIVSVMLGEFRKLYPTADISLVTMDNFVPGELFEGAVQYHSFFYSAVYTRGGTLGRAVKTTVVLTATTLWALLRRARIRATWLLPKEVQDTIGAYETADAVVAVGGGYLLGKNNLHDTVTALLQLHALFISSVLRKPYILFSQSVGPFGNFLQQWCAKRVLSKAELILPREQLSLDYLNKIGVQGPRVTLAADAALLFTHNNAAVPQELTRESGKKLIGITVRRWLSKESQDNFEQAIADFTKYLLAEGFIPVFIPQVTSAFHNDDDMAVVARIQVLLGVDGAKIIVLPNSLGAAEVHAAISACNYIVGTRMHSVIFALTAGVPAIAIAYERKTLGIMQSLGLKDYVLQMEDVTGQVLILAFAQLREQKDTYLGTLAQRLPEQTLLAKEAFIQTIATLKHIVQD